MAFPRGPKWEDDSLGYINADVSELEMNHDFFNDFLEKTLLYISINDGNKTSHRSQKRS